MCILSFKSEMRLGFSSLCGDVGVTVLLSSCSQLSKQFDYCVDLWSFGPPWDRSHRSYKLGPLPQGGDPNRVKLLQLLYNKKEELSAFKG